MRVFLSGGTGFFGKALLRLWASPEYAALKPARAYIISRDPSRFLRQCPEFEAFTWIEWLTADLATLDASGVVELAARLDDVTHVLHAATDSTNGPALGYQTQFDQILQGTRTMLALARRLGKPRFLITSSGGVYGDAPAGMTHISEDYLGLPDPLEAKNAYSLAKRASEHLCALASHEHGLPTIVCRPFAFSGPDLPLDVHFAIGNFVRDALFAETITVNGDGSPMRSYLDQEDLAEWLLRLLIDGEPGQAYNIGSDVAISIYDLAHLVRDLIAPGKPVEVRAQYDGVTPRKFYVPDTRKIRSALGLRQRISLEESILRMERENRTKPPSE